MFTYKGQTSCVLHSVFVLLQACMLYAKLPFLSFAFFLAHETKRCKNAHAAWTELYVKPFCKQCYCVRHSYAGYKITSVHYGQIFVAHSAMKFYCLSTALLSYALSIVRGQYMAGEKNLELHFSALLTSQHCTDLTKTSSRKEV